MAGRDLHAADALTPHGDSSQVAPVLDLRSSDRFEAGHRPGAANIPLEELPKRIHELPPSGASLTLFDDHPQRVQAAAALLKPDRWRLTLIFGPEWLMCGPIETGPSSARLWRPHDLLVEAMPILSRAWGDLQGRRALDLACGTGRDAVFLARSGLDVEAVDILPDALDRASDLARRNGVALHSRRADLESGHVIPASSYDLVLVFNFLHRPLFTDIRAAVRPDGFVIYETFLKASRETFGRPTRDTHLLNPGELAATFADWHVHVYREGLSSPRRIAAGLIAQTRA